MKSIADHPTDLMPSPPRGRRRWIYAAIALVLLAAGVQLGLAYRHYNENVAYVKLLDRAKYGGGMRTTHSTGRVHDLIAVIADTQWGPLPATGDWLQESWWLFGDPKEIQIAGPGVPLEEALAHIAGSRDLEEAGLFGWGKIGGELRHLTTCDRLTTLYLTNNQLTPAAFRHIAACEKLERLDLSRSTDVDDETVTLLKSLVGLNRLDLVSTSISDAGLAHLRELRPTFLDLRDTNVGDESIPTLVRMSPARLRLDGTRFTADGIAELRRSLPESDVAWTEGD
jgi:hypothetical protein